jgi:hypothetical protein
MQFGSRTPGSNANVAIAGYGKDILTISQVTDIQLIASLSSHLACGQNLPSPTAGPRSRKLSARAYTGNGTCNDKPHLSWGIDFNFFCENLFSRHNDDFSFNCFICFARSASVFFYFIIADPHPL